MRSDRIRVSRKLGDSMAGIGRIWPRDGVGSGSGVETPGGPLPDALWGRDACVWVYELSKYHISNYCNIDISPRRDDRELTSELISL